MLSQRFTDAIDYARRAHATQFRKGSDVPYLAHLLAVAGLVLENGGDEDTAIAALLHDVAEDQGGHAALEQIRQHFGEEVARVVDECSDTLESPKPAWHQRKENYLALLPRVSPAARLISQADK
jgi:(p)ppGpp synthase/HD superfamily hydrolase